MSKDLYVLPLNILFFFVVQTLISQTTGRAYRFPVKSISVVGSYNVYVWLAGPRRPVTEL